MANKQILAIGRITNGAVEIHLPPTLESRNLSAARWFGAQDAAKGEPCLPRKYFSSRDMQAAYVEGFDS